MIASVHMAIGGRRLCRGMTLVETLVAMFLLGLFIAGSVQVLNSARRTADTARTNFQAINMAKDRLERIRTFPFHQLGLAVESDVRLNDHGAVDANGPFRRSTSIETVEAGLRRVTVTVEVLNPRTRRFDGPRQTLESLIADFELAP